VFNVADELMRVFDTYSLVIDASRRSACMRGLHEYRGCRVSTLRLTYLISILVNLHTVSAARLKIDISVTYLSQTI